MQPNTQHTHTGNNATAFAVAQPGTTFKTNPATTCRYTSTGDDSSDDTKVDNAGIAG